MNNVLSATHIFLIAEEVGINEEGEIFGKHGRSASKYKAMHCKVIIGRNPIEANANTVAIQLPGNPVAYIGKCFTPN